MFLLRGSDRVCCSTSVPAPPGVCGRTIRSIDSTRLSSHTCTWTTYSTCCPLSSEIAQAALRERFGERSRPLLHVRWDRGLAALDALAEASSLGGPGQEPAGLLLGRPACAQTRDDRLDPLIILAPVPLPAGRRFLSSSSRRWFALLGDKALHARRDAVFVHRLDPTRAGLGSVCVRRPGAIAVVVMLTKIRGPPSQLAYGWRDPDRCRSVTARRLERRKDLALYCRDQVGGRLPCGDAVMRSCSRAYATSSARENRPTLRYQPQHLQLAIA